MALLDNGAIKAYGQIVSTFYSLFRIYYLPLNGTKRLLRHRVPTISLITFFDLFNKYPNINYVLLQRFEWISSYRKESLPMSRCDILSIGAKFTDSLVSKENTKDFLMSIQVIIATIHHSGTTWDSILDQAIRIEIREYRKFFLQEATCHGFYHINFNIA